MHDTELDRVWPSKSLPQAVVTGVENNGPAESIDEDRRARSHLCANCTSIGDSDNVALRHLRLQHDGASRNAASKSTSGDHETYRDDATDQDVDLQALNDDITTSTPSSMAPPSNTADVGISSASPSAANSRYEMPCAMGVVDQDAKQGLKPLLQEIASRVILMDVEEAALAEEAWIEFGDRWYESF